MTAGAGVRVVESISRGGDPIIIGAGLVGTVDSGEEADWGNAVGILWEFMELDGAGEDRHSDILVTP